MLTAIWNVVARPAAFFERLQEDDSLSRRAFWVVLLVAALAGVVGYVSALPTADAFGDTLIGTIGLVTTPLTLIVVTLLSWLVYGLLVRIGAGTEVKPWAVVGYALAPSLIIYTLVLLTAALFPVEVTRVTNLSTPEAAQEAALQVQREIQASTFGRGSQVLNYAASLWWLALIFIGVRAAGGRQKAMIATALAALLTLGTALLPFLLAPL